MVLKQRANFYNNISTEMVPCQKPMLLKDAVEFEKVCVRGCCSLVFCDGQLRVECGNVRCKGGPCTC